MELQRLDHLIDHQLGVGRVYASDLDARGDADLHAVCARTVELLADRIGCRQAVRRAEQFVTHPGAGLTAQQATDYAADRGADAGENQGADGCSGGGTCPGTACSAQAPGDGM